MIKIEGVSSVKFNVLVYTTFITYHYSKLVFECHNWVELVTIPDKSMMADFFTIRHVVRCVRARTILPKGWHMVRPAALLIYCFLIQL